MGPSPDDVQNLAPSDWDEYIGQDAVKAELEVRIQAAVIQRRSLGHVLLNTVAGGGKTTLARLIAERLGDDFVSYVMPISPRVMAQVVREHVGCVLLDEAHRLSRARQEEMLTLISDGYLALASGARLETEGALTVIMATTEPKDIIRPLWDRFIAHGCIPTFDRYADEELAQIAAQMGSRLDLELDEETCRIYGVASAGIPRHVAGYVTTHRDLQVTLDRPVTAAETLALLRTTEDGITAQHKLYMETLDILGGTKGVKLIASLLRTKIDVVEDLEVLLVERGYIEYTRLGREISPKGHAFLKGISDKPARNRRTA